MYVAIVKTAKDHPLWPGLPDNYPVHCKEFHSKDEAIKAHPEADVMTIEEYKALTQVLHELYPSPNKHKKTLIEAKQKRPWWAWLFFWRAY